MKTINFKQFGFYTDFAHNNMIVSDMRETFANMIYTHASGPIVSSLCSKIVGNEEDIELSDLEEKTLRDTVKSICSQNIIDAVIEIIGDENDSK